MNLLKLLILTLLIPFTLLAEETKIPLPPVPYDFLAKKEVQSFITMLVNTHHFKRDYVTSVLQNAKLDQETLDRYTGKYKVGSTNGSWERYKAHVLDPISLQKAKEFKQNYFTTLQRASREYGVDMDYIVGFIAVESKFGEFTGDFHIIDALATLAFHKNRMQTFFKSELKHLFLLTREEHRDINEQYGSFAGAMGCVQQVPSVQRKFGMDYNNDGIKDPWDLEDCIGIIAKFMHDKGWREGAVVVVPTNFEGTRFAQLKTTHRQQYAVSTLKKHGIQPLEPFNESKAYLLQTRNTTHDDVWMAGRNFRVLTRYNNATTYGVAIYLIAQAVK
jgi:membrane-bound lytic murein transglycosylase B